MGGWVGRIEKSVKAGNTCTSGIRGTLKHQTEELTLPAGQFENNQCELSRCSFQQDRGNGTIVHVSSAKHATTGLHKRREEERMDACTLMVHGTGGAEKFWTEFSPTPQKTQTKASFVSILGFSHLNWPQSFWSIASMTCSVARVLSSPLNT